MQTRVLQRHGHVAGQLGEKIFVLFGKAIASGLVKELDHADNFARVMADGHAQQRASLIIEPLIEARFEGRMLVCVFDVDGLCRLGHTPRNALPPRHANFLMIETKGDNRPQLFLLSVNQKHAAAISFHFLARNLQNQLKQFRKVECRVEEARCFK